MRLEILMDEARHVGSRPALLSHWQGPEHTANRHETPGDLIDLLPDLLSSAQANHHGTDCQFIDFLQAESQVHEQDVQASRHETHGISSVCTSEISDRCEQVFTVMQTRTKARSLDTGRVACSMVSRSTQRRPDPCPQTIAKTHLSTCSSARHPNDESFGKGSMVSWSSM